MKKCRLLLALFFSISCLLTACSDDEQINQNSSSRETVEDNEQGDTDSDSGGNTNDQSEVSSSENKIDEYKNSDGDRNTDSTEPREMMKMN